MPTLNLIETLSPKEKEVYDMLCANMSNEEIADTLDISVRGVVWRLSNIYKKLGVSSADKSDLHLCRQRAISYGGTKIVESVSYESGVYSKKQIMDAAKRLTWYDAHRVNEIVGDLLQLMDCADNSQVWNKLTSGVTAKEFNGGDHGGRDKHLLKTHA